jgi:hypothetical protein
MMARRSRNVSTAMRARVKIVILLVSSFAIAASWGSAQTVERPGFKSAHQPSAVESVAALMQSTDPRDQAWGAWYAGREVMPQLVPLLERVAGEHVGGGSQAAEAALDAAVDALIQLRAKVPEQLIRAIHERREAAALVLASQNVGAVTPFLLDVVTSGSAEQWFAAANLLLPSRPQGFAALLARSLTVQVQITISEDGNTGSGSGSAGGVAIGCGGSGLAPGLPPWAIYQLTGFAHPGVVVLATGPKPVYYRRSVSSAGSTPSASSSTEGGPSSELRLRYVAAVAGIDETQMPLQAVEWHSLRWQGIQHLDDAIGQIRGSIVQRHVQLLRLMVQRQVLLEDDIATLPAPAIEVVIHDARSNKSTPLGGL